MNRVTIGTDPEFFLEDKQTKKKISAIPYIEGTKHEPMFLSNGSKIQHDNVALEFATNPAKDATELALMIRETFTIIRPQIPEGLDIVADASAMFDDDQLDNYEALQFGCDPDHNAWTLKVNAPPDIATSLRSCGGHLHVGCTEGCGCEFLYEHEGKIHTVRLLDAFLGITSVIIDSSETSNKRRQLYGKAGCYRPTSYGVEYRVLSNFWLKSPSLVMLVDSLLQDSLSLLQKEDSKLFKGVRKNSALVEEIGPKNIQKIINKGNKEGALYLFNKHVKPHVSKETVGLVEEAIQTKTYKPIYQEWLNETNCITN